MTTQAPVRVCMPAFWLWLFRIGCPILGFALSFAVKPVVHWFISIFSSAPGPLKIAAIIPMPALIPVMTVLGLGIGIWIAETAKREALTVLVEPAGFFATHDDVERYVQRDQIGSLFTDPKDLVALDETGAELFRAPARDLSHKALASAFELHGYPWHGTTDPYEAEYVRWIDGHPDLDSATNSLLRDRRMARESKEFSKADELQRQLRASGIIVRDEKKGQQYRRLSS